MRRVIGVVAIVILVFGMAGLVAQAKPNFAGTWTLADPTAAATGGIFGLGIEFTAAQDDETLTVTPINHEVHVGERPEQLWAVYHLDGSESRNPLNLSGNAIDRNSTVKWDGARLIITTTTTSRGNESTQTQTWSLDPSGNLSVDAVLTYGGNSTAKKATYKKG